MYRHSIETADNHAPDSFLIRHDIRLLPCSTYAMQQSPPFNAYHAGNASLPLLRQTGSTTIQDAIRVERAQESCYGPE